MASATLKPAWLAVFAFGIAAAACGGDETSTNGQTNSSGQGASSQGGSGSGATTTSATGGSGTGASGVGGAGGAAGNYPPPPYGVEEGDTFPFIALQGYFNLTPTDLATTQPFGNYTSDDIRTSGNAHVMVHLAAMF
jgi:hypothetical protein